MKKRKKIFASMCAVLRLSERNKFLIVRIIYYGENSQGGCPSLTSFKFKNRLYFGAEVSIVASPRIRCLVGQKLLNCCRCD